MTRKEVIRLLDETDPGWNGHPADRWNGALYMWARYWARLDGLSVYPLEAEWTRHHVLNDFRRAIVATALGFEP